MPIQLVFPFLACKDYMLRVLYNHHIAVIKVGGKVNFVFSLHVQESWYVQRAWRSHAHVSVQHFVEHQWQTAPVSEKSLSFVCNRYWFTQKVVGDSST